ncbi:Ig-like domain-containing protein [Microbacterium sp.]|uniref:Ig-like domain-containing protein n=1 Tax=Microbacterium sp. TaxID=51671 RepID=UPI003A938F0F
MKRRSLIATLIATAAVAASVIAVSIVWPGLDAQRTPPEQTSVWALQTGEGRRYARVNTAIGELDTVRSVANPSAVASTGDGAYLFAESYGKLTRIDESMPADLDDTALREAPSTPAGTVEVSVDGDHVAYRTDAGTVFAGTLGAQPVQLNPDDVKPDAPQFTAQAIAVDDAGVVYAYSQDAATVVRFRISDGAVLSRDPVTDAPHDGALGLTAVGSRWFLVDADSGRIWTKGAAVRTVALAGDVAYGLARSSGDAAWIADDTGLVRLPANGGAPQRTVGGSTRDLGTPAAPVVDDGVVYAAWLGTDGGTLWRSDSGERVLDYGTDKAGQAGPPTLADERRPVFAGTGSSLILNETRSGWVWNAHTGALLPSSQDWSLDDRTAPQTSRSDERAQVVIDPKPPVAEADAFGVRAGSLVSLPVLLNDHDPNEDVLSIDPSSLTGLDPSFGSLSVTDNGQRLAVHVAADAHGTATFQYRVTDGTAANGLYSKPATVTLTVAPDARNSAPKWCGVAGCLARWPSPQVAPGGTLTIPVLDGWVDPDGDPLMLLSAVDTSGVGAVASTPGGDVVYQHADPSVTEPQIVQLQVTVGDVRGATATRSLSVRITPSPKLSAESFTEIAAQGSGLTVDVAPHVSGTQGHLSLTAVRVLDEAGADAVATSGGTAFDFTARAPGVYRVAYTVTDGNSDASATARITILPADAPAQLATAPVVAFVHPQQDVTLDVFTAVSNPTRRVLLLSDVQPEAAPGATMSVDVVGQNYLRVSGSTADGQPGRLGTVRYVVSDGTNDAGARVTGQATVYLLPASADLAPIAVDDAVVARVGAQVDIPVLDNDVAASGGAITLDPATVRSSSPAALAFASGRMLRYLAPDKPGDYRVEYSVYTAGAPSLKDTAVVRVKVISDESNRPPRPRTLTGRVLTGQTTTIPFRSFGVDPDGDDVSLDRILTQPASGSATISADGESITYTSVPGFHGQVSFTYRVVDAFGATGTGTVRVGVLDEQANPSPVTFTDYVQLQAGADNSARVSPLANDVDPTGGTLALDAVRPDAVQTLADGSPNPEYARLAALVSDVKDGQVEIHAGADPGTMSFLYDVTSSTGNTARGLIVVKVVREAVPDYPVITDTVLTAQTREQFPDGIDVITGHVSWTGGDVAGLKLSLWGDPAGVTVDGARLRGPLPAHTRIIPFALTGTSAAGEKVTSYGFLRIPGEDDLTLALKPDLRPQQVEEKKSVTFDMAQLVSLPTGATLEVGEKVTVTGARTQAACTRASGTKITYTAGEGAPWTDACVVTVRLAGQSEWTTLSVPISVNALAPVPVLAPASLTVTPGATVTYDLKKLTTWQGRTDWDRIAYSVQYAGRDFTVHQSGAQVTVTAGDAAIPGSEEVAVVGVTSHPGVAASRLILRVGPAPSALPKAGTVARTCSQANGSSCVIGVIGVAGESNPLPRTPMTVAAVAPAGACTGVTFTVADASHVRASWNSDAPGQTCTASFSVRDAQGRVTAGDRDGRVMLDLQGYPKAPVALVQSDYGDGSVTLRVDPGDARLAYPALSGFRIRYNGAVVVTCDANGTCPAIPAPNGDARRYEAKAFNAVGESSGSATTVAWAYDGPPTPGSVTATPIVTGGDGGYVSVRIDGIDTSKTAQLRLTSDTGDTVDVPVRRSTVTVSSYRIGSNDPTALTVTPMSRFTLPPGFDGSTSGQGKTILANGVGAPKNVSMSIRTKSAADDGSAVVTVTISADLNGAGSERRFGIVQDSGRCTVSSEGDASSYSEDFSADVGSRHTYAACVESDFDGRSFGRVDTDSQTYVVQPNRNGPTGYSFVVNPSPHVDNGAQTVQWLIDDAPTTTNKVPRGAEPEFLGWRSSVIGRDPQIQVRYSWLGGLYTSGWSDPIPRGAGSAPYQMQAQWQLEVCRGGEKLQSSGSSTDGIAAFSFNYANAVYKDAKGKTLATNDPTVVPDYAVSVSGIGVTISVTAGSHVNSPKNLSSFGGSCVPLAPLSTPSNLQVKKTAEGTLTVSWTSVARATKYVVQRAAPGGSFAEVATVTGISYDDAIDTTKSWSYRVIAQNGAGDSDPSGVVTYDPPGDTGG